MAATTPPLAAITSPIRKVVTLMFIVLKTADAASQSITTLSRKEFEETSVSSVAIFLKSFEYIPIAEAPIICFT